MEVQEVLDGLMRERGAVRAEVMPDDLCRRILEEEATVTGAMGSMPVRNSGLDECLRRNTVICVFEDETFWTPDEVTMHMVGEDGRIVGHDIPKSQILEYSKRHDVMFISEDFVMYPEIPLEGTPTMDMLAVPYRGSTGWIPEETGCVIWFPSPTSNTIIHRYFGQPLGELATAMVALDL